MDGIRPAPKRQTRNYTSGRPLSAAQSVAATKKLPVTPPPRTTRLAHLQRLAKSVRRAKQRSGKIKVSFELPLWLSKIVRFCRKHRLATRILAGFLAFLMLLTAAYEIYTVKFREDKYKLPDAALVLLPTPNPAFADKLQYDTQKQGYLYNAGFEAKEGIAGQTSTPRFTADFANDPTKGVSVTDPKNNVSLKMKPLYSLESPTKKDNRLIYPISGRNAASIYTVRKATLKQDIILNSFMGNELSFAYELGLPDGAEARLSKDGSVGIYGVDSVLLGDVTTGNEKDAALLQKARTGGVKNNLLFTIPAPFVLDGYKKTAEKVDVHYTLEQGNLLTVHAKGLKDAKYPLTIDPSVYIESAVKFMRGNNESNIDFDVANELIVKSPTTGARINSWTSTLSLTDAAWGQATASAGGFVYSAGGVVDTPGTQSSTSYSTAGSSSFVVPANVQNVTAKVWGAGGGGGVGSGGAAAGGNGGAGGYVSATVSVTAGETLTVDVGTGGTKGAALTAGGNGGGFSALRRSATYLAQAGGGGGGGGGGGTTAGGAGGAGGGTVGAAGTNSSSNAGAGGTASAGGAGGTTNGSGGATGATGAANAGGNQGGILAGCNTNVTTTGGNGGTGAGGGGNVTGSCRSGGGGGGGRFGGGGGGSASNGGGGNRGAGGGGGGSDLYTGVLVLESAGSGQTPGNNADSDRGTGGAAGSGSTSVAGASNGNPGKVVLYYTPVIPTVSARLYWAKFDSSSNNVVASPTTGDGTCTGWCNKSAYDMPAARKNASMVAYNGYLYVMGGEDSSGNPQSSVYIAKLGANGEPSLWHPTGGTAVYWYTDTGLGGGGGTARSKFGAVAYNNKMYIVGGLTTSTTLLTSNTVQVANVNPNGVLTGYTSTGMQAITGGTGRYGHTVQVYNNVLYIIGGDATFTGSPLTTVEYSKLNSDGTMNSWVATSSLATSGRLTMGGNFSAIWGAYVYVAGGCTAVNGSGYCTTIASDVQLASINADGSISEFNTILGLTNSRIGYTLSTWEGGLYRYGGCSSQDTSTGSCAGNTLSSVDYGVINVPGEASTVATSVASGVSPCSGANPYNCNLPGTTIIGNVLSGSAIMNGYLYIWGGCSNTNAGCGTVSRSVMYTSIGSDGTLTKPASCGTWTSVDSYCYNTTSLPASVGAPATAVFRGFIYSIGGFTAAGSVNSIYYAQPSAVDGTISSWSTVALSGGGSVGAEDVSYAYAFARANPSSAGSTPGNLYILGGCGTPAGIGCGTTSYTEGVYKCTISTAGVPAACSQNPGGTNQQLQIGTVTGANSAGLGAMAGTVYANYIYLMGGLADGATDLKTTRYAKIDSSNNIVAVSGSAWVESGSLTFFGRRRGAGFGYNGYLYVVGGYDGSGGGVLADIEFAKINVSDGSIGSWTVSSVSIDERWGLTMVISNSYAYVIGGCILGNAPTCSSGGQTNTIQTFQVYNNDSGAVKTYTASSNQFAASASRWGARSTILNGYLYVAGGCVSATCTTIPDVTTSVQYAQLSTSDGSIGTWNSATNGLPLARAWGYLTQVDGTLYYVGGEGDDGGGGYSTRVSSYHVTPAAGGNITSAWGTSSAALSNSRSMFGGATWDGRIYVIGGKTTGPGVRATVYYTNKLSGGAAISSWTSNANQINVSRAGLAAVAYANNLYIFGGNDLTNYLNDAQFASIGYKVGTVTQSGSTVTSASGSPTYTSAMIGSKISFASDGTIATITAVPTSTTLTVDVSRTLATASNYTISDGSVGAWSYTTSVPSSVSDATAVAANGYIYLIGGRRSASSCSPNTIITPISANTTIPTGNNPTGVGTWFETNTRYAGGRYGAAVSYGQGKVYVNGGGCAAPITGSYSTGTISQTTNTVTGSGTTWTDDYIGGTITYQDASTATIVGVTDATHLVVNVSKTVAAGQTYSIAVARHHYGVLKSQPQIAQYSRLIDTDLDVTPTKWLMNGVDNSIGARWQLSYQSMTNPSIASTCSYSTGTIQQIGTSVTGSGTTWTSAFNGGTIVYSDGTSGTISAATATTLTSSLTKTVTAGSSYSIRPPAMSTWGSTTNYGDVTLGLPATYGVKYSDGNQLGCARYYFLNVSIDSSQTFGYPEDVNRGPTISDISLFFVADPSLRLRHGKTFSGGQKQPLDTPF